VFHDGKFWGFVVCNIDRFYKHESILSLCQVSLLTKMTCDVKYWRELSTQMSCI